MRASYHPPLNSSRLRGGAWHGIRVHGTVYEPIAPARGQPLESRDQKTEARRC
jgi:hypothetical protein